MTENLDLFSQKEIKKCSTCQTCGSKNIEYRHNFNVGLATCLKLLFQNGGMAKIGSLGLNNSQFANFQKLQYWDLIYPYGKKRGWWAITPRGVEFLQGKRDIPSGIVTIKSRIVRSEGNSLNVWDIIKSWDEREYYVEQKRSQL